MERDLKFYKKVAKELRKRICGITSETNVKVVATEYGVDIFPAKTNTTGSFYYTEKMVDICRFLGLSNYVTVRDGKTVAHIY